MSVKKDLSAYLSLALVALAAVIFCAAGFAHKASSHTLELGLFVLTGAVICGSTWWSSGLRSRPPILHLVESLPSNGPRLIPGSARRSSGARGGG